MNIRNLPDDELVEKYEKQANAVINNPPNASPRFSFIANAYLAEIQRRGNEKSNKAMRNWTIAIGIMTAVMLGATILNVIISCGG